LIIYYRYRRRSSSLIGISKNILKEKSITIKTVKTVKNYKTIHT